ncbi:MAG TPA: heat-inducible transcriptional repressor HrcA [Actinomycetota bacterium]
MTEPYELTDRKADILRALVRHYIRTGEPVGSESLAGATGLRVSSATIRNELASLEELGYLTQPHPSAGRVPTDLAYRRYVDLLPTRTKLREPERRAIVGFFDEALADVDAILRGTTQLLSRLTRYASLALAPSQRETAIIRSELIRLGTAVLLLVVFDTGHVEKRVIESAGELADEDVDRVSRKMTEAFRGKTLSEADAIALELERSAESRDRVILTRVAEALSSIGETAETEHILLGGVANIAADAGFDRRETLRQIYEALERESAVLRLLREAAATPPVSVTIGRENRVPEMWEASLVAAPFAAGGALGTIGVVGPMRMDYLSAISAVRAVAERLSAAVEALSH